MDNETGDRAIAAERADEASPAAAAGRGTGRPSEVRLIPLVVPLLAVFLALCAAVILSQV